MRTRTVNWNTSLTAYIFKGRPWCCPVAVRRAKM